MTESAVESADVSDDADEVHIGRDELFKLLGNERRRHVVEFLREREETVSLDTLATHVAASENDTALEDVTGRQRKRVYTSLQQTHLPRLDEAGAVAFDKEGGTITPADTLTQVTLHLDVVSPGGIPESVGYLFGAACSTLLLVAVLVDAPLVSRVPALWWAGVVLCSFAAVAGVRRILQARGDDPV